MIEMVLPEDIGHFAHEYLRDQSDLPILGVWSQLLASGESLVRVLLEAEHTEAVLDVLEDNYGSIEGFRAILLPVEASLPRPEPAEEVSAKAEPTERGRPQRISREELYYDVVDATKLSKVYVAMVLLSAIVASIGVLRDNLAAVIGAMVIAPLLGPSAALSLATTLGDGSLARTALKASAVGIGLALALSFAVGYLLDVDPSIHEIASRTDVGLSDIAIALAAGVLAFTSGAIDARGGYGCGGPSAPAGYLRPFTGIKVPSTGLGGTASFSDQFHSHQPFRGGLFFVPGCESAGLVGGRSGQEGCRKAVLLWFTLLFGLVAIIALS